MPKGVYERKIKARDLKGERFGLFTVMEPHPTIKYRWLIKCECGAVHYVNAGDLLRSKRPSRGCRNCRSRINRTETHGLSNSAEYRIWASMVSRCTNSNDCNYPRYGARGIRVCKEWVGAGGFERFFDHIGPRPFERFTIDRIDGSRGYEPGNLRWASYKTQARNKRNSVFIELNGERMNLVDASSRVGLRRHTIPSYRQTRPGYSHQEAFNEYVLERGIWP